MPNIFNDCKETSSMAEINKENHVFKLSDGRNRRYAESGDVKGKAMFYFHGLPGSPIDIILFGDKAKEFDFFQL
jgi:hypothetical protein